MVTIFSLDNQKPDIICLLSLHSYPWYLLHRGRTFPLVFTWRWNFLIDCLCHIYHLNINFRFFMSWKPYVVFVQLACHRWSTNLFDMDLIKENQLGWCQRWKLFFVVPGWFMPYFYLLPFVNNKQYGESEMSQYVVFVYIFAFNFAPCSFSSGSLLIIINHCFTCWYLASFHFPSFLVPCCIYEFLLF